MKSKNKPLVYTYHTEIASDKQGFTDKSMRLKDDGEILFIEK